MAFETPMNRTDKRTTAGLVITLFVLLVLSYAVYASFYRSNSNDVLPGAAPIEAPAALSTPAAQ